MTDRRTDGRFEEQMDDPCLFLYTTMFVSVVRIYFLQKTCNGCFPFFTKLYQLRWVYEHAQKTIIHFDVGWLAVFYVSSTAYHLKTASHLLSLAKDAKLGFYTVPTGNRTPGRRVAVHYTTAVPRQLLYIFKQTSIEIKYVLCAQI